MDGKKDYWFVMLIVGVSICIMFWIMSVNCIKRTEDKTVDLKQFTRESITTNTKNINTGFGSVNGKQWILIIGGKEIPHITIFAEVKDLEKIIKKLKETLAILDNPVKRRGEMDMKDLPLLWIKESLKKAKKEVKDMEKFYERIADEGSILANRVRGIIHVKKEIVRLYKNLMREEKQDGSNFYNI